MKIKSITSLIALSFCTLCITLVTSCNSITEPFPEKIEPEYEVKIDIESDVKAEKNEEFGNYIGDLTIESISYKIIYDHLGQIIDVLTMYDTTSYILDTFKIIKGEIKNSFKIIGKCESECLSIERNWSPEKILTDSCLIDLQGYYNRLNMIINQNEHTLHIESIVKSGNSKIHPPEVTKCRFTGYKS